MSSTLLKFCYLYPSTGSSSLLFAYFKTISCCLDLIVGPRLIVPRNRYRLSGTIRSLVVFTRRLLSRQIDTIGLS